MDNGLDLQDYSQNIDDNEIRKELDEMREDLEIKQGLEFVKEYYGTAITKKSIQRLKSNESDYTRELHDELSGSEEEQISN